VETTLSPAPMPAMMAAWVCAMSVCVAGSVLATAANVPFATRSELWTVMRADGGAFWRVMTALPMTPIASCAAVMLVEVDLIAAAALASLEDGQLEKGGE
jgi:hypothetical protein